MLSHCKCFQVFQYCFLQISNMRHGYMCFWGAVAGWIPLLLVSVLKLSTTQCGFNATIGMLKNSLTFKNRSATLSTSFWSSKLFSFFLFLAPVRLLPSNKFFQKIAPSVEIGYRHAASDPPSRAGGKNPGEPIMVKVPCGARWEGLLNYKTALRNCGNKSLFCQSTFHWKQSWTCWEICWIVSLVSSFLWIW